jgi:hypothetical protein
LGAYQEITSFCRVRKSLSRLCRPAIFIGSYSAMAPWICSRRRPWGLSRGGLCEVDRGDAGGFGLFEDSAERWAARDAAPRACTSQARPVRVACIAGDRLWRAGEDALQGAAEKPAVSRVAGRPAAGIYYPRVRGRGLGEGEGVSEERPGLSRLNTLLRCHWEYRRRCCHRVLTDRLEMPQT